MSIKDVIYRVVHDYPGGVPALAARMDMSKHVLQNKVNPNNNTHHLTINELVQIQEFTNSDEIAKHLAGERNMVCFPVTQHQGASDMELLDLFINMEREKSDWMGAIQLSLKDGVIDPVEAVGIKKESRDYLAVVAELISRIDGMVQDRRKTVRGK